MTVTDDLMSALEGDEVTAPIPDPDAATIDMVDEWVAQVNRLNAQEAEYVEAHKSAVAKLTARKADRLAAIAEQRSYLEDALETYHRARLAQDPESRTIPTPSGVLKSTKQQDEWIIEDTEAFTEWAVIGIPTAVTLADPVVNRAKAKKAIAELAERFSDERVLLKDGTAIPGLRVIVKDETKDRNFSVKEG